MEYPEGYSGKINLRVDVGPESDIDRYSIYLSSEGDVRTVIAGQAAKHSMNAGPTNFDDEISLSKVPREVLSEFQRQLELFGYDSALDASSDHGLTITRPTVAIEFNEYLVDERDGYYAAKRNGDRIDRNELPADIREFSDWVIGVEED